jgi:chorismate mutase
MSARRRHCAALTVLIAALVTTPTQAQADSVSPLTELVHAAAQRLQAAEPVAAFKWSADLAVEDPGRVRQELTKLRAAAVAQHLDPDYVAAVFIDQIHGTEALEYSRFAEWKLDPTAVPAAPPDLSASRSAIDALNQTMLSQMARNWELLHSPGCVAQLDEARGNVIRTRQLDGLFQRILLMVSHSYCQGPAV